MARKILFLYILCIPLLILSGCSKPYQDALPTVQFVSVTPYGVEDSVLITGKVTSSGASPVEYTGFSFSTAPSFDLLSRQVLLDGTIGLFSAVVPAQHDSTFYFKCFAANEYGYCASSVFKYTIPATAPDSAPCTLSSNSFLLNGTSYPFSYISSSGYPSYGSYGVQAEFSGGYYFYDVYFNMVPVNGQYTVLSIYDFINTTNKYAVALDLNASYGFNEGGYVYVSQNKDGTTTLSFCSLVVNISSQDNTVSSKVTF